MISPEEEYGGVHPGINCLLTQGLAPKVGTPWVLKAGAEVLRWSALGHTSGFPIGSLSGVLTKVKH